MGTTHLSCSKKGAVPTNSANIRSYSPSQRLAMGTSHLRGSKAGVGPPYRANIGSYSPSLRANELYRSATHHSGSYNRVYSTL